MQRMKRATMVGLWLSKAMRDGYRRLRAMTVKGSKRWVSKETGDDYRREYAIST